MSCLVHKSIHYASLTREKPGEAKTVPKQEEITNRQDQSKPGRRNTRHPGSEESSRTPAHRGKPTTDRESRRTSQLGATVQPVEVGRPFLSGRRVLPVGKSQSCRKEVFTCRKEAFTCRKESSICKGGGGGVGHAFFKHTETSLSDAAEPAVEEAIKTTLCRHELRPSTKSWAVNPSKKVHPPPQARQPARQSGSSQLASSRGVSRTQAHQPGSRPLP